MKMYGFNFDIDTGQNGPAAPRQFIRERTLSRPGPPHRLTQVIPEEWMTRANRHRRRHLFAREPCTEGCRLREEGSW